MFYHFTFLAIALALFGVTASASRVTCGLTWCVASVRDLRGDRARVPSAIRSLAESGGELVPWGWGINGATSVVGTVLATVIAIYWGFTVLGHTIRRAAG